ncbi:MAG: glycerol-3-phosphate 1-O-acyltransferase, partial [Lysobacterales bacterium]
MMDLLIKMALAYLLGSVSGSMVVGGIRRVDIRSSGSGNAGGTNAFRTQGFAFALPVVIIDVGKGALAAWLLPQLDLAALGQPAPQLYQLVGCAFAAVVGHCYPVWYGFRGGKGAATAVGALLVIQPLVAPPMLATWLVVLTLTGWVGLSTMLAAVSLVPALLWLDAPAPLLGFGVLLAAFIVFTHRGNIRKMLNG